MNSLEGKSGKKRGGGRPPWAPADLKQVETLASRGLTLEQIAAALGIDVSTLYRKKLQLREFREALEKGKANGIAAVANKLFERGMEGEIGALIFFLKHNAGWSDRQKVELSGSLTTGNSSEERVRMLELVRAMSPEDRATYVEIMKRAEDRRKVQNGGPEGSDPAQI